MTRYMIKYRDAQFDELPFEMLDEICENLDDDDLNAFTTTTKKNREACIDILNKRKIQYLQQCKNMEIEDLIEFAKSSQLRRKICSKTLISKNAEGKDSWNYPTYIQQMIHKSSYSSRHIENIKLLLDAGVDPNITTKYDRDSLLHYASLINNYPAVKLLIDAGANVNIKNKSGNTPLADANDVNVIKILLENGADPNIIGTSLYETPLHTMIRIFNHNLHHMSKYSKKTFHDIVDIFIKYGADISIKNGRGKTVRQIILDTPELYKILKDIPAFAM